MQRKRNWWLPYVVLEYDKNEVLIDALGGDLAKPEWNYRADLYAHIPIFHDCQSSPDLGCLYSLAMSPVHPPSRYQHICGQPNACKGKMIWAMTFSWLG